MAHTKQQGAASRTVNVEGKRLGIKRFSGEFVHDGTIIVRQKGTKFHPGRNTQIGHDFTIFATQDGYVSFRNMTGYKRARKCVDVTAKAAEAKSKKK